MVSRHPHLGILPLGAMAIEMGSLRRPLLTAAVIVLGSGLMAACGSARPGVPAADPEARVLRVVSYNIRHGRGVDDRVDLERTAEVLRRLSPDVVGLQEVDEGVERSGRVDQAQALGTRLGMDHTFGAFFEYQGGEYGMAILSRHPILGAEPLPLPEGNEPRVALVAQIELPGGEVLSLVNVHFDWVGEDTFRYAQALEVAAALDTLPSPYILLGDFNDGPDSRTLALFRTRALEAEKPADARFTFPSGSPQREIDYVFAGPPGSGRFVTTVVINEDTASDHRPVLAVYERALGEGR